MTSEFGASPRVTTCGSNTSGPISAWARRQLQPNVTSRPVRRRRIDPALSRNLKPPPIGGGAFTVRLRENRAVGRTKVHASSGVPQRRLVARRMLGEPVDRLGPVGAFDHVELDKCPAPETCFPGATRVFQAFRQKPTMREQIFPHMADPFRARRRARAGPRCPSQYNAL